MVMGTILQVSVIADDVKSARQAAESAIAEAKRWDDILTTWRPEGELAQLNRAAGRGEIPITPELRIALERMLALSERTAGAFDPGVGPAVSGWRTHSPSIGIPKSMRSSVRLGPASARLNEDAGLDAGAIGKGMALDAIATLLRRRGVQAAFLDFGGSSQLAIGAPPESPTGWIVAVTGLVPGIVHGTIALRDCSLSTSRTTRSDASQGPIVDPRDGKPVTRLRAVTVLHGQATEADAWSTALVVLGRHGTRHAEEAGIELLFEDSDGTVRTPGFSLETYAPKST
jgi:thiamine biosynthesis lipoprotein